MEEAKFSVNWKMFNSDGVALQFTVRHDEPAAFTDNMDSLIAHLLTTGFTWTEQPKAEKVKGQYETDHIIGYMVGAVQKGKSMGQPVIYCYNMRSKFSAYYLYQEDQHLLPAKWPAAPEYDGTAPDKETALNHRKFHKVEWDLPITPRLLPDGEVEKKNGYIQYKPNREATLDGAPAAAASPNVGKQGKAPAYITATVTEYKHKREVPQAAAFTAAMLNEGMAKEDSDTDWWRQLAPAQQDTMSYARSFVRGYSNARTDSNPKGVVALNSSIEVLHKAVTAMAQQLVVKPLPQPTVLTYASWLLSDQVPEMPDGEGDTWGTMVGSTPLGVTTWLAECALATSNNGKPSAKHDPDWLKCFAEIILRCVSSEGASNDDEDLPF